MVCIIVVVGLITVQKYYIICTVLMSSDIPWARHFSSPVLIWNLNLHERISQRFI